jgi:signal peptidase I
MRILKQFLHTLLTIVVLMVLPLAIFTLITSKTNILGGMQSFVVLTGSMEPTVPVGSIIYTFPLKGYAYGDIVAFKSGNVIVTHRISDISFKNSVVYYQTKGDANEVRDQQEITNGEILGKTFLTIPIIGKISNLLKTPVGFILAIVFGFIIFEFCNLIKEIEKETERKLLKKMQVQ